MTEIITSIEDYEGGTGYAREAGFKIITTEQEIVLAIDDSQDCCEEWGYFLTEDDTSKYVGAELRGVTLTDTNRSSRKFLTSYGGKYEEDDVHLDSGDVMFVDIETDRGVLQFVAYNAHNGYYGHEARVSSKQLQHAVTL
jgi:hypothetical protein